MILLAAKNLGNRLHKSVVGALDLLVVVLLLSVSLHIEGTAPPLLEAAYCSQRRDQLFGVAQVLIRSTAVTEAVEAVEAVEATLKDFVNLCPVLC